MSDQEHPGWCEALYEARSAHLILYGRALGLSHGEAEDVLQDTFVELLKRDAPPENPGHYCLRSYRNRCLNYRRSLWRRLTRELESSAWFEPPAHDPGSAEAAARCLEELPREQREIIVLKLWHRLTFEQIGDMLDISPNTAAGRYRYGLQKIRTRLKGPSHEPTEPVGSALARLAAAPAVAAS
ncbi:MAG: sigma-70 family RNA polymerase sigma factor [Verrucomicrobiota bacterium]